MQMMRNMGLTAPAPLERYDWPGRFKPYAHQKQIAQFLVENRRAYNLSGLGTGKTKATAWAADFLMKEGIIRRCLIAAPLSCIERVWGDELYQSFPKRKFVILHGSRQARLDLLKQDWDFAVINHHGLAIIADHLPKDVDLVIIDELAVFRSKKAKTLWGEAKKIITPEKWAWGLTGSPTPNAPTDAYAQSKLITPERYNGSFTRFKMETMAQLGPFRYVPRPRSEELVNQILQPSIRFALEDCIDLPETIYLDRDAEMSKEQEFHYKKLLKECMTEIRGATVTAVNAAVLFNKLLQSAVGCLYDSAGNTHEIDFGPRMSVIEEVIEETDGKVILFMPLTGALHALHKKLKDRYTCEIVEGDTSSTKRNQIFSDFSHAKDPRIIIASPATMSHGLSLHQQCATTIWACPVPSNEIFMQANARTVRPGQKSVTRIICISASPVERKIYRVLKERGRFQDLVLNLAKDS
jgi:SNF2 family DNA or RNA helicase